MATSLNFQTPLAYQPLEAELRADISNGRLQPGDKICPELKLAQRYHISRGSVRLALDNLVQAGLLVKVRGSGTFVASAPALKPRAAKVPHIVFLSLATALSHETFFSSTTYVPMLNGMMEACREQECNLLVAHISTDWQVPPCLSNHEVDGVIFHGQMPVEFYRQWIKDLPHIALQYPAPEPGSLCIKGDNQEFSFQAVRKLQEQGCSRIGFVSNEIDMPISLERYYAYRMALRHYNLPLDERYCAVWQRASTSGVLGNELVMPDYRVQLQKMFAQAPYPDGLICVDDWRARCTIAALNRMGFKVPEDVCVLGGRNELGEALPPKISGFSFRLHDICFQAVTLLQKALRGELNLSGTLMIPPQFCAGQTLQHR